MTDVSENELCEIGPYDDSQYQEALHRVLSSPAAREIVTHYFPGWEFTKFSEYATSAKTILSFQQKLVAPAIDAMLAQTTDGMTVSSIENITKNDGYVFISNHRDILLDSALFIQHLIKNEYRAPGICLGDNLLKSPLVRDLVKMNRGITVKRRLAPRELMKWSFVLSTLIFQERKTDRSVWIAQREGRTKNGYDETQGAVVKMLALASPDDWIDHLKFLRIVPVTVSYEWEPCDFFKARERYLTQKLGTYAKAENEDVKSMMAGIKDSKGRIHIKVGSEISDELENLRPIKQRNPLMKEVALTIDRQIQSNFTRWPSNFIARDLLRGVRGLDSTYSDDDEQRFTQRLEKGLREMVESDRDGVRQYFLKLYARPLGEF